MRARRSNRPTSGARPRATGSSSTCCTACPWTRRRPRRPPRRRRPRQSTSPSPTATSTSPPPTTNPVVVIYMENKERSSVVGSSSAPYQNALRAQGIDFTHAYGVTHPSLPNYLALGNGATNGKQGTDSISAGELSASPTLWNQLQNAGISWGVYEEDMPAACSGATTSGLYALKHNPATPFASVYHDGATCGHVQPFSAFDVTHMPAVSFVAPNLCNDEHDCGLSTGDGWLQAHVQPMLANGATVDPHLRRGFDERGDQRIVGRRQHLHRRRRAARVGARRRGPVQPVLDPRRDRSEVRTHAAERRGQRHAAAVVLSVVRVRAARRAVRTRTAQTAVALRCTRRAADRYGSRRPASRSSVRSCPYATGSRSSGARSEKSRIPTHESSRQPASVPGARSTRRPTATGSRSRGCRSRPGHPALGCASA